MFNTITPTWAHNLLKGGTTLIAQLSWVIYLTKKKIYIIMNIIMSSV